MSDCSNAHVKPVGPGTDSPTCHTGPVHPSWSTKPQTVRGQRRRAVSAWFQSLTCAITCDDVGADARLPDRSVRSNRTRQGNSGKLLLAGPLGPRPLGPSFKQALACGTTRSWTTRSTSEPLRAQLCGLKRHPIHQKFCLRSSLVTLQGVASPPLPIGCGRELLRLYIPVQGHKGTVSDVRHTSSLTARSSTKGRAQQGGAAMAIPLDPRRGQGRFRTSGRGGRRSRGKHIFVTSYGT